MSKFLDYLDTRVLVLDGAMGSRIQEANLTLEDFAGLENCSEILQETRPDLVRSIHDSYLEVGCSGVETNTFGATPLVLDEYDTHAEEQRQLLKAMSQDSSGQ